MTAVHIRVWLKTVGNQEKVFKTNSYGGRDVPDLADEIYAEGRGAIDRRAAYDIARKALLAHAEAYFPENPTAAQGM